MAKKMVLKLGTKCREMATGLDGTLTHWVLDMGDHFEYIFQPRGLEDGQPIKKLSVCGARLLVKDTDFEEVELPTEVLGSTVIDDLSGFKGMAVSLVKHINGCLHLTIQPRGTLRGKYSPIDFIEADIRQCKGKMITPLSEAEKKKSEEEKPSPAGGIPRRGVPTTPAPPRRPGI